MGGVFVIRVKNNYQAVIDAALSLPKRHRTRLLERLLDALSPEPEILADEDFVRELRRRSKEMERGKDTMISWKEMNHQMRA